MKTKPKNIVVTYIREQEEIGYCVKNTSDFSLYTFDGVEYNKVKNSTNPITFDSIIFNVKTVGKTKPKSTSSPKLKFGGADNKKLF